MLVAAVIQTCRLELLEPPAKMPPSSYTSLKEALRILYYKINMHYIVSLQYSVY
jgi:hypothetical protein